MKTMKIICMVALNILYITISSVSMPVNIYPRSIASIYKHKPGLKTAITTTTSERVPTFYHSPSFRRGLSPNIMDRRSNGISKAVSKPKVDIGVQVKYPTTPKQYKDNLEKLENALEKVLRGQLRVSNATSCPSCEGDEDAALRKYMLKPAYACDEWDSKLRLCILERNIGDTVTFYLSTGYSEGRRPNVTWKKEFHIQYSNARKEIVLRADNPPENIIIGKKGYELRVSPITEIDLGYNLFSATLDTHSSTHNKVFFMIRIVPIDLGFVYVGETIELNLRSFVTLPAASVTFRWYMERDGEGGTLPSNMRTSASGSSIKISELRQDQEGVLACTVYTNLDFLATKKRFLMKNLVKNNDVLKSVPDHDLHFEEEPNRGKRFPKTVRRSKREAGDWAEKALMSPNSTKSLLTNRRDVTSRNYDEYDLRKDFGTEESRANGYRSSLRGSEQSGFLEPPKPQAFDRGPLEDFRLQSTNDAPEIEAYVNSNLKNTAPVKNPHNEFPNNQQLKPLSKNSEGKALQEDSQQPAPQEDIPEENEKYIAQDIDDKNNNYAPVNQHSEIILNIEKIPGPKIFSAQEKIAKMISSCFNDIECSANAICVRSNLKHPGHCKCLTGFYGVGIFCREDIWISKSNFEMEENRNLEDTSYLNSASEDTI